VAAYLAELADQGRSVSTVQQRAAAIRWAHEAQGHESPTTHKGVRATLKGIRRELGVAPSKKSAATVERVASMVGRLDRSTVKGKRDAALLLLGFASAMRRSELVGLEVGDVEPVSGGLLVTLRRSKTDQEGQGHKRAIPHGRTPELCPVKALEDWLEVAGIEEGPVFRSVSRHGTVGKSLSGRAVALVVKEHAGAAGLDAADFGAHSLRAGFITSAITSAAERGKRTERIMDHTGHQSLATVRGYMRPVDAFADHAGEGLL
jgi:integrase